MIKIGTMARRLGVSVDTLRRWDRNGDFVAHRTSKGMRYYTEQQYQEMYLKRVELWHSEMEKISEFESNQANKLKLFRPKEFSDLIGVCTQTLINWDKSGKFPAKKDAFGRRYYTYDDYITLKGGTHHER